MTRINVVDLNTGEIKEETEKQMVIAAFQRFDGFMATDWELKASIEKHSDQVIDERNWVSARRSELIGEGLVKATNQKRLGEFNKPCTVWVFMPNGTKDDKGCLSSAGMARVRKYIHDKCQMANKYQRGEMCKIIEHFENETNN